MIVPYVFNARRDSDAPQRADATRRAIEEASGLRVTHLISNTHIGRGTTVEDVVRGLELAREVAGGWGVPILAAGALGSLAARVSSEVPDVPVIAIPPCLGLPWEYGGGLAPWNGAGAYEPDRSG